MPQIRTGQPPDRASLSLWRLAPAHAGWYLTSMAITLATKLRNTKLTANMIDIKLMSPSEIAVELGYRLKSRRLALRMTQEELAARTDLNVGTIKNLEAKTTGSTLDTLIRIASALGVSDQFETLFVEKPKSISQMEQVATAPRVRARRSRHQ